MATSSESVLILGCGFAGLWAAQGAAQGAGEVTVLDRTNHHLFTPLLYQVATEQYVTERVGRGSGTTANCLTRAVPPRRLGRRL